MTSQPSTQVRLCCFKGLQTLPVLMALRHGVFARLGLAVELSYTTGSAEQIRGLAAGAYELIQTAPDNVVHVDSDPAAFGLAPHTAPRVMMLLGGSNGPLTVFAQSTIHSLGDLRGRVLGVDNPTSGFALVLRDLLARGGLTLDRDYTFAVTGSTQMRLAALLRGEIAATLLYPPFDLVARAAACQPLATSTAFYQAYASQSTAACAPWLEAHGDVAVRYISAILSALRAIYDPQQRNEVELVLATEPSLGLDATLAAQAYEAFTHPLHGFGPQASLDEAGLAQVIAIRAQYAQPTHPLGPPSEYCDPKWYAQAREMLG